MSQHPSYIKLRDLLERSYDHAATLRNEWVPETALADIWPEIEKLINAVDDLHSCIGTEFRDLQPETQEFVVALHTQLHHAEDIVMACSKCGYPILAPPDYIGKECIGCGGTFKERHD